MLWYLVDHHHSKQVAYGGKEKSVKVVLRIFADCVTEDVYDHLPNDEEEYPKRNVAQRPAILQRVGDENDLHHHVHEQADAVDYVEHQE